VQVEVGEMSSTVHVADSRALLSPAVLEQVAAAVMTRLRAELAHERRIDEERRLGGQPAERGHHWPGLP
jgi:hypothetical protein